MAKIKTDLPAYANANSAPAPAAIEEVQPQRGGSFVRNPDGTLTQTEGHGFAQDNNQPNQE